MEATQSSRQRCSFIYFKTITLASTCTLLQTTNLGFQPAEQSQEEVKRWWCNKLLHNTFFSLSFVSGGFEPQKNKSSASQRDTLLSFWSQIRSAAVHPFWQLCNVTWDFNRFEFSFDICMKVASYVDIKENIQGYFKFGLYSADNCSHWPTDTNQPQHHHQHLELIV